MCDCFLIFFYKFFKYDEWLNVGHAFPRPHLFWDGGSIIFIHFLSLLLKRLYFHKLKSYYRTWVYLLNIEVGNIN